MSTKKNGRSPIREFLALSDEQKRRAVARFDREFVADEARPASAAEKRQWKRVRTKLGRPVRGKGHKVISVSIERGLLTRCDKLARRKHTTRAAIIARGLEHMLVEDSG